MANTYGIEAALRVIEKEIKDVFAVYGKASILRAGAGQASWHRAGTGCAWSGYVHSGDTTTVGVPEGEGIWVAVPLLWRPQGFLPSAARPFEEASFGRASPFLLLSGFLLPSK